MCFGHRVVHDPVTFKGGIRMGRDMIRVSYGSPLVDCDVNNDRCRVHRADHIFGDKRGACAPAIKTAPTTKSARRIAWAMLYSFDMRAWSQPLNWSPNERTRSASTSTIATSPQPQRNTSGTTPHNAAPYNECPARLQAGYAPEQHTLSAVVLLKQLFPDLGRHAPSDLAHGRK